MSGHLRGILVLFVLSLLLCCGIYPLVLWAIGNSAFPVQAKGSMIEVDGAVRGSSLIGQPFSGAGYFQPRPSAAGSGYDASLSGGSNLAASNIKLRDRVARILGTVARFKSSGGAVGPAIDAWFAAHTDPKKVKSGETDAVSQWEDRFPTIAGAWASTDAAKDFVVAQWQKDNNKKPVEKPSDDDLKAYSFFHSFAKANPGKWPVVKDKKTADGKAVFDEKGKPVKEVVLVTADDHDDDVHSTFFEMWYQDAKPDLEPVPADMVLASGSGLDPHITLRSANYQALGVIAQRAADYVNEIRERAGQAKLEGDALSAEAKKFEPSVKKVVNGLIETHAATILWGIAGGDRLVNVLELNLDLDRAMKDFKPQ